jgi:DNA-binding transcriptional MerR regulator
MSTSNIPKNADNFKCAKCNFKCSKQSNWNIHIMTAKHKRQHNQLEKCQKMPDYHECECGKIYKERTGLWRHKQKCTYVDTINEDKLDEIQKSIEHVNANENENEPTSEASTILLLLKQNQEFKSLMVEQYTQLQEKNQELQQQLVDAVKNNTGSMTNCNNNTTNNNNHFNLNFFLNDTCKDAMNITDFLGNMDVHIDELEYIGNHGYVNGMTKMIMERLKEMDITKRPIHCTDIKRETMYIKDKDEWSKDTDELTKVRKILNRISMNNYRTIPEWKSAHPECEVVASRTYDFCYSMMESLLGDVEDEQLKLDNKIIKTMAKTLYVNKINA